MAAVQEEATFGGSRTTAFSLQPDLAIVVDVTHATDAPGIDAKEIGKHAFGSGPVIERGSILNPHVFEACTTPPRRRASRSPSRPTAAAPAPTPRRSTSPAAASRAAA